MTKRNFTVSTAIRDAVIASAIVFLIGTCVGAGVYLSAADGLKREVQNNLLSVARSAAELTDIKAHEQITQPSDFGNSTYEKIRSPYFKLLKANPDLAYIYTNVQKGNSLYFIMDAEVPRPGVTSQPSGVMEEYKDATATLKKAFATGQAKVEDNTYTDEYGTFLSAYAPLMDGDRFIGTIGVDIRVTTYLSHLNAIRESLLLGLLLTFAASAGVGLLVWKLRKKALAADAAAQLQASEIQNLQQSHLQDERQNAKIEADRRRRTMTSATDFQCQIQNILDAVLQTSAGIAAKAVDVSTIAAETRTHAGSVVQSSGEAVSRAKHVAQAAHELSSSIAEISRQSTLSRQVAVEAAQQAEQASDNLTSLTEKSAQVSEVLSIISEIASQINLLALNATIESARAGEAGKGFAVVANEVKTLSNRVTAASHEITRQIGDMQTATAVSVRGVEAIREIIGQVLGTSNSVAAAVEQQSAVVAEIEQSVDISAHGAQAIGSDISRVQSAANDTGKSATFVLQAADDLTEKTKQMGNCVSDFVSLVSQI